MAVPIEEVNQNLTDIPHDVEKKALISLDGLWEFNLQLGELTNEEREIIKKGGGSSIITAYKKQRQM